MKRTEHLEALLAERDLRYTREAELRAEALKIKQQANDEALNRDREDRRYKDEQANKWREQVAQERVESREREQRFVTHEDYDRRHNDLAKEVARVATVQAEGGGRESGRLDARTVVFAAAGIGVALVGILMASHVFG